MFDDASLLRFCNAGIERSLFQDAPLLHTTWYKDQTVAVLPAVMECITLAEGELPLALTFMNAENWTFLTTRHLYTFMTDQLYHAPCEELESCGGSMMVKNFKVPYAIETASLKDNKSMPVFIETGKSAMVMLAALDKTIFRYKKLARQGLS